jgi:hypothetical protein
MVASARRSVRNRKIRIAGDLAYVPLTKGLEAVIDASDVDLVEGFKWFARIKKGATSYAVRRATDSDGRNLDVYMHRVIAQTPTEFDTDHVDGNGLNNRRSNLRYATKSQNMHNMRKRRDNTSGFKGVSWHKSSEKWMARIRLNGEQHHIGSFTTLQAAHEAYSQVSSRMHGEYARAS